MGEKYSISPEDPEQYLRDKFETREDQTTEQADEVATAMESLESPIWQSQETKILDEDSGYREISCNRNGVVAQIFESPACGNGLRDLKDILHVYNRKVAQEDLFKIDNFVFAIGEGKKIYYAEIIPHNYSVFSVPGPGLANDEMHLITTRDFSTSRGIITLFHEAGHAQISNSLSEEDAKLFRYALWDAQDARNADIRKLGIYLKVERDAWAFAIKKLRPLMGKNENEGLFTKEELLAYVHSHALSSYGEYFAKSKGLKHKEIDLVDEVEEMIRAA